MSTGNAPEYSLSSCLCSRVIEAGPCKAIVIPAIGKDLGIQLRENDLSWKDFLSSLDHLPRYLKYHCLKYFELVRCDNKLFEYFFFSSSQL